MEEQLKDKLVGEEVAIANKELEAQTAALKKELVSSGARSSPNGRGWGELLAPLHRSTGSLHTKLGMQTNQDTLSRNPTNRFRNDELL